MEYTSKHIKVNLGLSGVQHNPEMYIGELGEEGIFHLIKEVVENSIDEYIIKENNFIGLDISRDGEWQRISVYDNGRGIPVETHEITKKSTLTTIMTYLHSGGKFEKGAYDKSRGLHGVGVSCVNALSEELEVYTKRDKWFYQKFKKGKAKTKVINKKPEKSNFSVPSRGTIVSFIPNYGILGNADVNVGKVREWLKDITYLNANLKIVLSVDGRQETFLNKNGLSQYLKDFTSKRKLKTIGRPFVHDEDGVIAVIQWTDYDSADGVQSYVNGCRTVDGGSHLLGFYDAVNRAFKKYAKSTSWDAVDIRYGMVGFVNISMENPRFDGNKKDKLLTAKAKSVVSNSVYSGFSEFLSSNKTLITKITKQATKLTALRNRRKELIKLTSDIEDKSKSAIVLPGKLVSAKCKPEDRELYLLEGDGAGGTGKKARDKRFQEVLPLRGKIINSFKKNLDVILKNPEAKNILISTGSDILNMSIKDKTFRVGKVFLLMDADDDGLHIRNLVTSLFYKVCPEVYDKGLIYDVNVPLYFANWKDEKYYGYTWDEIRESLPKEAPNSAITRAKGWGEMPWKMLKALAFDPETRRIIKIDGIPPERVDNFEGLFGENTIERKKLLNLI